MNISKGNLLNQIEKLEQENKKLRDENKLFRKLVYKTPYKCMNYYSILKEIDNT